eukprot:4555567-Prymnesium_polylepis.1
MCIRDSHWLAVAGTTSLCDGAYHTTAAARESGTVTLYVDGNLEASGSGTMHSILPSVTTSMYTARPPSVHNSGTTDYVFWGDIQYMAIMSESVTATTALQHHSTFRSSFPTPPPSSPPPPSPP